MFLNYDQLKIINKNKNNNKNNHKFNEPKNYAKLNFWSLSKMIFYYY